MCLGYGLIDFVGGQEWFDTYFQHLFIENGKNANKQSSI